MDDTETYERDLGKLRGSPSIVEVAGAPIEVRSTGDPAGGLDPRVLRLLGGQVPGAMFPQSTGPGSFEPSPADIERVRAGMGWPNRDLSPGSVRTDERTIVGNGMQVPVRVYTPRTEGPKPAVVFFHGGAFFGGSLRTLDNPCRAIADRAGALVISVDYRLAPEHPFPVGLDDCFAAIAWVHAGAAALGVDARRIVVAGDSAGGNLAAACAIRDRDAGTRLIALQALIYPTVDLVLQPRRDYAWSASAYRALRDRDLIEAMIGSMRKDLPTVRFLYLRGHDPADPLVSPLFLDDFSGLAPALIVTAEYDALRLEAEAYARWLRKAGVRTRTIRYAGMEHAFFDKLGFYPQAEDCVDQIVAEIRSMPGA